MRGKQFLARARFTHQQDAGIGTGDFISLTCIELNNVYPCVPTLRALPGDTLIAQYQDPSNHSDTAWISIKVDVGGGETSLGTGSTTAFVNADGVETETFGEGEEIYVQVIDPSQVAPGSRSAAIQSGR